VIRWRNSVRTARAGSSFRRTAPPSLRAIFHLPAEPCGRNRILRQADRVTTDVPGFATFSGTSAAAPHAARIAALLKSYNPKLTSAQITELLTTTTLDIMSPGVDRDSGYGIVMVPAILEATSPEPLRVTPQTGFKPLATREARSLCVTDYFYLDQCWVCSIHLVARQYFGLA